MQPTTLNPNVRKLIRHASIDKLIDKHATKHVSKPNAKPIFECSVCCSEYKENKINKKLVCLRCEYVVCSHCQKMYCKADCMNCHFEFSYLVLTEKLGNTFIQNTMKPNIIKNMVIEKKAELKNYRHLVEWKQTMNYLQKRHRFGELFTAPKKPNLESNDSTGYHFPCPSNKCKGCYLLTSEQYRLVVNRTKVKCAKAEETTVTEPNTHSNCTVCKSTICCFCECIIADNKSEHVCDKNTVENRVSILTETKPCPKCRTRVFRISGCDHMHCTFCNSHFHWVTGELITNSTNHHYQRLGLLVRRAENQGDCLNEISEYPLIAYSVLAEKFPYWDVDIDANAFVQALYEESEKIRYLKFTEKYSELWMERNRLQKMEDLCLGYLINEINEQSWGQSLYSFERNSRRDSHIARVYQLYLSCVDQLLSDMFNGVVVNTSTAREIYLELVRLTTESLNSIREEFGFTDSPIFRSFILPVVDTTAVTTELKLTESSATKELEKEPAPQLLDKHKIKLYEYQENHVRNLEGVLLRNYYALDMSMLGTGKTYTTSKIFQKYLFGFKHMVVVAPVPVLAKWKDVVQKYALNNVTLLSYNELRSTRGTQPKHGLLSRRDYYEEDTEMGTLRTVEIVEFKPTALYTKMCVERTLLVFDEFQNLKNNGAQSLAARTLIVPIRKMFYDQTNSVGWRQSRVLLLSGSPMDKEDQYFNLMRTLGVLQNKNIVRYLVENTYRSTQEMYDFGGAMEVYSHIESLCNVSEETAKRISEIGNYLLPSKNRAKKPSDIQYVYQHYQSETKPPTNKKSVNKSQNRKIIPMQQRQWIMFNEMFGGPPGKQWWSMSSESMSKTIRMNLFYLFVKYHLPAVSSTMIQLNTAMESEKVSASYIIQNHRDYMIIQKGLGKMMSAIKSMENNHNPNMKELRERHAYIMEGLNIIECGMLNTIARVCRQRMEENPCLKVVVGLNYSENLKDLNNMLGDFWPLIYSGKQTRQQKEDALTKFQSASAEHRLLIGNVQCLSTGIDLDDKDGRFPRLCLCRPNYNTISLYQLGFRFNRGLETRSKARIELLYAGEHPEQDQIIACNEPRAQNASINERKSNDEDNDEAMSAQMKNNKNPQKRMLEKALIKKLAVKSNVMKMVSSKQSEIGITFPGEYNLWFEEPPVFTHLNV